MKFWIDIETIAWVKVGPGPVISASEWESEDLLDKCGRFQFTMPASDPITAHLTAKRVVKCYGVINSVVTLVGAGIIDEIATRVSETGEATLVIGGDNIGRELTYRQVGTLALTTTAAPQNIIALAPTGWTLDTVNGHDVTIKAIAHAFEGESVLNAFVRLAEITGEHFRISSDRKVVWIQRIDAGAATASGVRAIQGGDPIALESNPAVCLITDLEVLQDTYDLITRVYPYGVGNGDARATLTGTTKSWAGYTVSTTNNYICRDAAEVTYGQIDRYISWKDITDADTLAEATYEHLVRYSFPYLSYRIGLSGLKSALLPGTTLKVVYHRWVDGYHAVNIDTDLYILGVTNQIDDNGYRTIAVDVASLDRWYESDESATMGGTGKARDYYTYPQPQGAGEVGSGSATDGQILTANGSGATAWETFTIPDGDHSHPGLAYSNDLHSGLWRRNSLIGLTTGGDTNRGITVNSTGTMTFGDGLTIEEAGDTTWVGAGSGIPYGSIYTDNGTETLLLTTSFQQIVNFDTEGADGLSNLMTPDHANNKLTITTAGTYRIHGKFSGKTSKVNAIYVAIFIDGVEQNNIESEASGAENQFVCIVAEGLASIAANKDITIRIKAVTGADMPTVTLAHVNIEATMVGGN
jgi:hypothetical protein